MAETLNTFLLAFHLVKKIRGILAVFFIFVSFSLISSCKSPFARLLEHQNAGNEAYRRGDYDKAEKEYKVAIKEAEEDNHGNVMVIICLRSLAQVHIAQNKYSDAEIIYKRRISLAANSLARDPIYLATIYDDLATFYLLQNRIEEAKPIYEQAISLTEEAYGTNDLRVAEKLEYYATLLKAKGQDTEAAQIERRAALLR